VHCARCGADTTSPWPTAAELDEAYGGAYRPEDGRFAGGGDLLLRWSRGRLARRLDRTAPPGRILDVGAGDGALLDALHRRGRPALGLERDRRRADVVDRDVLDVDGAWAAVVFWHSLEHLPRPGAALQHACGLLADRGRLVVAVPDAGSVQARAFGEHWFHVDLPRHLVHLPAATLLTDLRRAGLRVERISRLRGGQTLFGWLHGIVRLLPGAPNLYDAIRQPAARAVPLTARRRALVLAAAVVLLPLAAVAAVLELATRSGGTVYVEAVRG
jgi:SAM-dependent methyltransferase